MNKEKLPASVKKLFRDSIKIVGFLEINFDVITKPLG
jgi:hypothetical protein